MRSPGVEIISQKSFPMKNEFLRSPQPLGKLPWLNSGAIPVHKYQKAFEKLPLSEFPHFS